jgi:hypothetical protein
MEPEIRPYDDISDLETFVQRYTLPVVKHNQGVLVRSDYDTFMDFDLDPIPLETPGRSELLSLILATINRYVTFNNLRQDQKEDKYRQLFDELNFAVASMSHDRRSDPPEIYAEQVKRKAQAMVSIEETFDKFMSVVSDLQGCDQLLQPINMGFGLKSRHTKRLKYFAGQDIYRPVVLVADP